MSRYLRWHWHRLCGWLHLIVADRRFDQANWHVARSDRHNDAADRILWPPPPRGPPGTYAPADGDRAPPNT